MRPTRLAGLATAFIALGAVLLFDTGAKAEPQVVVLDQTQAYDPPSVTVDAGEDVQWVFANDGPVYHSVTSDTGVFDSHPNCVNTAPTCGDITDSDPIFERVFNTPGDYPYYCRVHGSTTTGMRGVVHVVAASPTPSQSVSPTPSQSVSPTPSQSVSPTPSQSVSPSPTSGPTVPTSITLQVTHAKITAGNRPTLFGFLKNSTGAPLANRAVKITNKAYGQNAWSTLTTVNTDANGRFATLIAPHRQTAFGAEVGALHAKGVLVQVHRRLNITTPTPNVTVNTRTSFAGTSLPGESGIAIGLAVIRNGRWTYLTQQNTTAGGNWTIPATVPRGTYQFVMYASAHNGTLGASKSVTVTVV